MFQWDAVDTSPDLGVKCPQNMWNMSSDYYIEYPYGYSI